MYPGLEELVETTCTTLLMNIAVAFENIFDEIKLGNYYKIANKRHIYHLVARFVFVILKQQEP